MESPPLSLVGLSCFPRRTLYSMGENVRRRRGADACCRGAAPTDGRGLESVEIPSKRETRVEIRHRGYGSLDEARPSTVLRKTLTIVFETMKRPAERPRRRKTAHRVTCLGGRLRRSELRSTASAPCVSSAKRSAKRPRDPTASSLDRPCELRLSRKTQRAPSPSLPFSLSPSLSLSSREKERSRTHLGERERERAAREGGSPLRFHFTFLFLFFIFYFFTTTTAL